MKNWRGTGGVSSSSSNLSASAPPFTVPWAFPYLNLTPSADSAEGSSVMPPENREHDSWDCLAVMSSNRYLGSVHEVDVPYANYYPFTGPEISVEMNTQVPSWGIPVAVASTDSMVSHDLSASNLGKNVEAGPSYSSHSLLGVAVSDSLLTSNHSSYVGPSAPKPYEGKSGELASDVRTIGFSIVSNPLDDRLDGSAVGYPLKSGRTDGSYQLEEEKLAGEHIPKTYNGQDVWSNTRDGSAVKHPHESTQVDGKNWLTEGQLASRHLTGTSSGDVAWTDGWDGPAVEYPFKIAQEAGQESRHQARNFEFATDIWKHQTGYTPLWEQSTRQHGPYTDYESLGLKSPSAPAASLQADAPSVAVGLVTQSKCNNDIDGDNANFTNMMPFHSMESYPLLGTANKLQFDATYSKIQPDTTAFESLYITKDEGIPKEKFSSKNSFNLVPQSSSNTGFSSQYLDNSAKGASAHLVCGEAGSDPWGFRLSDWDANSPFFYKGLVNEESGDKPVGDGFCAWDIPIQRPTGSLFQEIGIENTNQAVSAEGSESFLKPPAVPYTSDVEKKIVGTAEVSSCELKEIQSPHGTYRTSATDHDDLRVQSHNRGLNSCFPLQQKLVEDGRTSYNMHPYGDHVTSNEKGVQNFPNDSAEATSVFIKEISGSNFSAPVPWNLSGQEKGGSAPKVDLQLMVLTLHNLSELLHSYCSTGKCGVSEKDRHLLEKAINNLGACSTKDAVLSAEKEELDSSEEEPSQCLDVCTKLDVGHLDDQPHGANKQVNSLCREESSLEMQSPGVDLPTLKDNDSTQVDDPILHDGKQPKPEEGKIGSKTFSSVLSSHMVKDDNVVQAIKEILSQNYHEGPESDPEVHLFRNLWLEAEAELCSLKCKARFDRFKSKWNASEIKESSETDSALEKPLNPAASTNFMVDDKFSFTTNIEKNQKLVDTPRNCIDMKAGDERDVMASFDFSGGRSHDLNSRKDMKVEQKIQVEVPQLKTAKDAAADFLSEKVGMSPHRSSIVKGTTCSNIEDAVISRFNILLQRDERLSATRNNLIDTEAVGRRLEQSTCQRDFPEQNKAEDLESSLSECRGSPSPGVPESFVMSRLSIIKQRDENASSIENIVYQENTEVGPEEESVDEHGVGEIGCPSSTAMHYYDILSSSGSGECISDSLLDRFKILKLRDENQSIAANTMFHESVDLGSNIRGDYLTSYGEKTAAEGPVAKAGHVLRAGISFPADDRAKMDIVRGMEDKSASSSYLGKHTSILSAGWLDVASSDWEHVLKEEAAGGTSER